MPAFIPGLELSQIFYEEAVRPLLQAEFPQLPYSAALIGPGSEVLGFDTEMSTDHHWGPRVMLFLLERDIHEKEKISARLSATLPRSIRTWPTSFTPPLEGQVTQLLDDRTEGPVNHRVEINTLEQYLFDYTGLRLRERGKELELTAADWLVIPQQKLATLTSGRVFHDDNDIGLTRVREQLSWFPRDVWLYLMASAWMRIEQEGHLMGRAGMVADELGSSIIGGRIVRDIMRLCFLMEKTYAPYPKWFGTAFARLKCAGALKPHLLQSLHADSWQLREEGICHAYEVVAQMQVELLRSAGELSFSAEQTQTLPQKPFCFFDRPFLVISTGQFSSAIKSAIVDPALERIASRRLIGGIDLFTDSTDLSEGPWADVLRGLFT